MDKIVIEGGVPLSGTVQVSGAKNAALAILASALLADGDHLVRNVPDLADVPHHGPAARPHGLQLRAERRHHAASIRVPPAVRPEAPYELVKTMRASVLVLGPLVARSGGPASRCPAAAPSAPGPSTST